MFKLFSNALIYFKIMYLLRVMEYIYCLQEHTHTHTHAPIRLTHYTRSTNSSIIFALRILYPIVQSLDAQILCDQNILYQLSVSCIDNVLDVV